MDGASYEVFDLKTNQSIQDVFLAGWARKPSVGLVGVARKDATNAVQVVLRYLESILPVSSPVSERVREKMLRVNKPVVDKQSLLRLDLLEKDRARELGVTSFKFATNEEMLRILNLV